MEPTPERTLAEIPASPRRRPRLVGLVAAIGVSALSLWASARLYKREAPAAASQPAGVTLGSGEVRLAPGAPQWSLLKIGTAAPAVGHFTDPLPARVKIDEAKAAKVSSPLTGRVTAVYVELGQRVKKGAPLFAVASPDLATLRADRTRTEVDLTVAKTTLERVRAMVAARALPAREELAAQQAYRQAEVQARLAGAKLGSLKVRARGADNEFTATAPRDGVVVEKNVLPSQEAATDGKDALVLIADLSTVWVVADLPEVDAVDIADGTAAIITSPSLPGTEIKGTVAVVSSVVDPERHTIPIRVRLDNATGKLRPNMYAQVRFALKPAAGAVEIAASALVSDGAKQSVYVEEKPGQFVIREVKAGSVREGRVPILGGLKQGERVVERGAILLDNQLALTR
ncbi:MAG TPA: efflux RND transporter periplasmic adaptor subunit [Polyangia bacterium]